APPPLQSGSRHYHRSKKRCSVQFHVLVVHFQSLYRPPMPPKSEHGKICYIEIPATDVQRSADFYSRVFGWRIRQRGDGATAFDDTTGQVSGAWRLGRPPTTSLGLLIYINVDSV